MNKIYNIIDTLYLTIQDLYPDGTITMFDDYLYITYPDFEIKIIVDKRK
jgi:hypothetical protein